jgi:hypothetical protein
MSVLQLVLNDAINAATKETPFMINFGRNGNVIGRKQSALADEVNSVE